MELVASWIAAYAVAALRHVYRDSLGKTIAKAAGIWMLYATSGAVVMVGLAY